MSVADCCRLILSRHPIIRAVDSLCAARPASRAGMIRIQLSASIARTYRSTERNQFSRKVRQSDQGLCKLRMPGQLPLEAVPTVITRQVQLTHRFDGRKLSFAKQHVMCWLVATHQ